MRLGPRKKFVKLVNKISLGLAGISSLLLFFEYSIVEVILLSIFDIVVLRLVLFLMFFNQ